MANEPVVPVSALAELFELTEIRIQQLAKEGHVYRAEHGQYFLWQSIKGYVKFLKSSPRKQRAEITEDSQDIEKHKLRLTRAKADMAEIQAEIMKGTAHDAEAVAAVWADMIGNAKQKLLEIPASIAKVLEGMTVQERQEAIRKAIHKALSELADYSPEVITKQYIEAHQDEPVAYMEDDEIINDTK